MAGRIERLCTHRVSALSTKPLAQTDSRLVKSCSSDANSSSAARGSDPPVRNHTGANPALEIREAKDWKEPGTFV